MAIREQRSLTFLCRLQGKGGRGGQRLGRGLSGEPSASFWSRREKRFWGGCSPFGEGAGRAPNPPKPRGGRSEGDPPQGLPLKQASRAGSLSGHNFSVFRRVPHGRRLGDPTVRRDPRPPPGSTGRVLPEVPKPQRNRGARTSPGANRDPLQAALPCGASSVRPGGGGGSGEGAPAGG